MIRLVKGSFPGHEDYIPTYIESEPMVVHRDDGLPVSLHLWDVSIREHGETMIKEVYPGTDVALLCFSISHPNSFKRIEEVWLPEAQQLVPTAKHLLVGLCIDLRGDAEYVTQLKTRNQEMVTRQQGQEMAKMLKLGGYVECSALTGEGADDVLRAALLLAKPASKKDGCALL
jgi:GTPase SAR1 family protein